MIPARYLTFPRISRARKSLGHAAHAGLGTAVRGFRIPVGGFLILAQGRTGSSLLSDLLGSHPSLETAKERLFTPIPYPGAYLLGHAARATVCGQLWGFKAKNYQLAQAFEGKERAFIEELNSRNWRFVYLKRENFLAAALSTIVGLQRGKFKYRRGEIATFPVLTIDPQEFRNHISGRLRQNEIDKRLLEDIDAFEVVYEKHLAEGGDPRRMREIQTFLQVPHHDLKSAFRKTETGHVSDYVRNWRELRQVAIDMGHRKLAELTFQTRVERDAVS